MDQNAVATAIGSITNPGVWFGENEEGRKNARECKEYGAKLAQDYPLARGFSGRSILGVRDEAARVGILH